jgi:DNA-binding NarL/FixJ family response regulator
MDSHICRVLLVDDHPAMRWAMRTLLTSYGDVQVVGEAGDGKEAIEQAASCQPDVILMDINMPQMNGIQATSAIRETWKDMSIIGLCAVQDVYATDAFLKAGALAVYSKDRFENLQNLHSTIHKACMRKTENHRWS